jgi:hypothetical protein
MPAKRPDSTVDNRQWRRAHSAGGSAEGSVTPQGALALHAPNGARIEGQIDGHGTVTGRLTSACSYQVVWQKKTK